MPKILTAEQKAEQKKIRLAYAKKYYLANRDRLIKYAREKCKYAGKRVYLESDDPTKGKAFKRISKKDPDFSRSEIQKAIVELPPKKPRKAPLPPKPVKKSVATSSKDDAKPKKKFIIKEDKPKPVIKKTKKKFIIKEPKEEPTAKTRVTELYKLILKLNNSKNNLVDYQLNFPSVKKYNNELNDYETKIKNITKNLIEKTFNKKYDVSLVRRGEGDTIEYIYMLVINAKEFDFSRMILLDVMDDLKPYLKIKNLTEKENDLLIKVLNEPKPVFNDKYKKALRKEKDEEKEEPTAKTPEDLIILIQMADEVNKMASLKHIQKSKSLDELRKLEKKYNEKKVKITKYLKGLSSKYPVKEVTFYRNHPTISMLFYYLKRDLTINLSKGEKKISDVYNDTTNNFWRRIKAQLIKLKVDNFNIILNERIEKEDKEKEDKKIKISDIELTQAFNSMIDEQKKNKQIKKKMLKNK